MLALPHYKDSFFIDFDVSSEISPTIKNQNLPLPSLSLLNNYNLLILPS